MRVFNGDGIGGTQRGYRRVRTAAAATGAIGDFNDDDAMDAADYVMWRNCSARRACPLLRRDGDGDRHGRSGRLRRVDNELRRNTAVRSRRWGASGEWRHRRESAARDCRRERCRSDSLSADGYSNLARPAHAPSETTADVETALDIARGASLAMLEVSLRATRLSHASTTADQHFQSR